MQALRHPGVRLRVSSPPVRLSKALIRPVSLLLIATGSPGERHELQPKGDQQLHAAGSTRQKVLIQKSLIVS